jgi:hypothetical protein
MKNLPDIYFGRLIAFASVALHSMLKRAGSKKELSALGLFFFSGSSA